MSEATLYVPVPPRSRGCERGCEAGALIARSQRPRRRPVQELEIRNWGMRFRASGFRGQGFAVRISQFVNRAPVSRKSAAHPDKRRDWGRLKAKMEPLLTSGNSGFLKSGFAFREAGSGFWLDF